MKNLFIGFFLICITHFAVAQSPAGSEAAEKLESVKIGLITQRLSLTPEQSKQFWPIYDRYSKERKEVHDQIKSMRGRGEVNKTDEELRRDMEKLFELEEKKVSIDRKYFKEFQKVITIRQIAELYKAEHHFRRILLEQLGRRKGDRQSKDDIDE